ncbi:MAG: ribosome maturation factor RimP [Pyrinomonadaceae bacterium]|nr:ribosome maturation factor RimP [Pyrinomonadaceae bacterium]MCX7639215.1 ribosome maturation factor RimP [Pyrinomonadaceae bacterium]MDW8303563.1 ribosome maturation factor RimP [Acidobacteriota bacterium]
MGASLGESRLILFTGMEKSWLTEKVRAIALQVTENEGLELVHVEVIGLARKPVVRIYIDKPAGVTLDDCANVSRKVEAILDVEDFIPTSYLLEVSSPGIERQLYSLKDFEKFIGHAAKVRMSEPIDGRKNFRGIIKSVNGNEITILDRTSGEVKISYNLVEKANLEMDLRKELKRGK